MKRVWILLLVLLTASISLHAQENPPLLAILEGEVFRVVEDALEPYPACMPDERLTNQVSIAPDGQYLLLTTFPPLIDEAILELGSLGGVPLGFNIWLCDLATDTLERVYAVPGGDEAFTGEIPELDVINSRPVWSPDGAVLAWANLDALSQEQYIIRYDVTTGEEERSPLDVPLPFGFFAPPELRWGDNSIFFTVSILNEETFLDEETFYVVDPQSGDVVSENLLLAAGEQGDFILERLPIVGQEGLDGLALRYFQAGWVLANPRSGEQEPMPELPELYTSTAPQGLTLLMDIDENYNYNWQVLGLTESVELIGYPRERIAIAPDGQAVAYADSVLHVLYADGSSVEIANSDSFADDFSAMVLWGGTQWRIAGTAQSAPTEQATQAPLSVCEGAQPSRLQANTQGRVISQTVPMNVRNQPTTSGALVGQIPGGESFTVLSQAECADGYAWVQVRYGDLEGWVAEAGAEYFLEPDL